MIICFAYPEDLDQMYAFYCARYENITYEEFSIKLNSLPESEPLYTIIKSRSINVNKIKDKDERKHWRELQKINRIPDIYRSNEEIQQEMKKALKNNKLGGY